MQNNFNPYDILNEIDFTAIKKNPPILIAARFWEKDRFEAARICYQFMRKIDDLVDERKADLKSISDCEKKLFEDKINEWIGCLNGGSLNDPLFSEVADTISTYKIPIGQFQIFASSMIYDIYNKTFPTFDDFLKYAEGASVAPASVFVHLCSWSSELNEYVIPDLDLVAASRPCSIFSYLVHIIRDFQQDQFENLNYFADEYLTKNNLTPDNLKEIANGNHLSENFRNLIKDYVNYAEFYKNETEKVINKLTPFLSPRYLLSLKIIFELYKQVFERIDLKNGTFSKDELNPTPSEMKDRILEVIDKAGWGSNQESRIAAS